MITQAPRGTKDWFGRDIEIKNKIQEMAREIAASFNFTEISTPAFEHTQLFNRVGEDTDVVQKEMYTFEDKGGRSISLKPEGTSPVIRAYLEHNMYANAAPTKLFYFTQAFRYEKPASGRLRQHHQFGCELIGSKFPIAEFEVILIAKTLIERLGLKDMKLHINSIAEGECRENYKKALLSFLDGHSGKLCSTCRDRMKNNPLRVIDCKVEGCKEIIKDAPRIIEFLDDECQSHMQELENLLKTHNIDYVVDKDIVRGLDYYTKTVFEFIDKDGFTLCGGGRYDKLIKEIDGKNDIPAVGFGMGIERIIYFLEKEKIEIDIDTTPDIYIGNINNQDKAYELALNLRNQGIRVETDVMNRSLKAQMKYADKIRAKYSVVIGDDEVIKGEAVLKNMSSGEKTLVRLDEIGGKLNGKY